MTPYGWHWFRRDLRLAGNPALGWSLAQHDGRVLGIFCFDRAFLSRPDFSTDRFGFFLETLAALREEMRERGGELLCLDIGPDAAFTDLVAALRARDIPLPATCSWNRDYEPFAVQRDRRVESFFSEHGVRSHTERDHLLFEPHEIFKGDHPSEGYVVYSAFRKKWMAALATDEGRARVRRAGQRRAPRFSLTWKKLWKGNSPFTDCLDLYGAANRAHVEVKLPPAGARAARSRLAAFRARLSDYARARDFPADEGTSRLSLYLKNGSLTTAEILSELDLVDRGSAGKYLGELVWREFFYHILARYPHVEHSPFQRRYAAIRWENPEEKFEAWKAGRTGFPFVDAAMRELYATGWMHNRARMVVASFLTKDLLVDYRWGERWFMERLLDGDLAPNNGGWQWAASTGCDAQPYFRVFSPLLQSKKFDPQGDYIRRFVPELRDLPAKAIHDPTPSQRGKRYPAPIVDHAEARKKAIALFRAAR